MKQAFELGWLAAYTHIGTQAIPKIYHIDDIQFLTSVQIGSIVNMKATVSYVKENILSVFVEVY